MQLILWYACHGKLSSLYFPKIFNYLWKYFLLHCHKLKQKVAKVFLFFFFWKWCVKRFSFLKLFWLKCETWCNGDEMMKRLIPSFYFSRMATVSFPSKIKIHSTGEFRRIQNDYGAAWQSADNICLQVFRNRRIISAFSLFDAGLECRRTKNYSIFFFIGVFFTWKKYFLFINCKKWEMFHNIFNIYLKFLFVFSFLPLKCYERIFRTHFVLFRN